MIELMTAMVVLGLVAATFGLAGYLILQYREPTNDTMPLCYCQQCGRCQHQVMMNWTRSRYLCVECCDDLAHSLKRDNSR